MRGVIIQCFCQWVGEQAEGKDNGSGDCDYDCDCDVEWGGGQLRVSGCVLVGGGATIVQGRQHAGVFCMVIFTLLIHKYNVIDEIV